MAVELEGNDAYDEYFDSLTPAERNRQLKGASRYSGVVATRPATTVVEQREVHWAIKLSGYGLQMIGATVEGIGVLAIWIGKGVQQLGKSLYR